MDKAQIELEQIFKNNINIELAHYYGFQEVKSPLYVSRARSLSLSFNTLSR